MKKMEKKDKYIQNIDKYWSLVNYLTLAQIYLKDNLYLKESLKPKHLKDRISGHWGTSPGINFIYSHLNHFIKRHKKNILLVNGLGHSAGAVLSNLFVEGTLGKYYSGLDVTKDGIEKFINSFGAIDGFRSEINPQIPGTIYDGGELGYSLPVAFGAILDNPDLIAVCIIGDGEAETGSISASWNCIKHINSKFSGVVLPIIHLNGFKMGSASTLSLMNDDEILAYFKALGYEPRIVINKHEEMYDAFEWVKTRIDNIKNKYNTNKAKFPLLILKSPKGWTAIKYKSVKIEGESSSHKLPIKDFKNNQDNIEYLEKWLKSYKLDELFQEDGLPVKEIIEILPEDQMKIGRNINSYGGHIRRDLIFKNIERNALELDNNRGLSKHSNVKLLCNYFKDLLEDNKNNFRIISPDELTSNLLGELLEVTYRNTDYYINGLPSNVEEDGRLMEILNENICQAWMQGYILTGRHCIMPAYESFMPIITSMVSQFAKYIYQSKKLEWRKPISSLNYLLTSLCWSNTYSHQNPEFINSVLNKNYSFVRVYFPCDANSLLVSTHECLNSTNRINVIISSKKNMPQWYDYNSAKNAIKEGVTTWEWLEDTSKKPDIVLASIGDYPTIETVECIKELNNILPSINCRFVSISELTVIGSRKLYPHAIDDDLYYDIFPSKTPKIFNFHGYPSIIKNLLFEREESRNLQVMGYKDLSDISGTDMDKMFLNGVSRYNIAIEVLKLLFENSSIDKKTYDKTISYYKVKIEEKFLISSLGGVESD